MSIYSYIFLNGSKRIRERGQNVGLYDNHGRPNQITQGSTVEIR